MKTGAQALAAAVARLRAADVPDAPRDARRLLAHAIGVETGRLTLVLHDRLSPKIVVAFDAAIARRAAREPVSHITGRRAFYGRDFLVTPDVLDPRPETETLIANALNVPFSRVLDLGTGSGCILLTLLAERATATGVGVDLSAPAVAVAQQNAQLLGLSATFIQSDWFAQIDGQFDLIVSNPPYITQQEMNDLSPEVLHEPHMALTPGGDGLDAYRSIAAAVLPHLMPGGHLLVEIGALQGHSVKTVFEQAGLDDVRVHRDLDGRDRVVQARAGA